MKVANGWWAQLADGEAFIELEVSERFFDRMTSMQKLFSTCDNSLTGYLIAISQTFLNIPYLFNRDTRNILGSLPVYPSQIRILQSTPSLKVSVRVGHLVPGEDVPNR